MTNVEVQQILDDCALDLGRVASIHAMVGATSTTALYLTRYALIRACGAVEVSYKALVADYCSHRSKRQVKQYLARMVRRSSKNPSYENICKLLAEFDSDWKKRFKAAIDARSNAAQLKSALESLVDARNDFAHGGSPSVTLGDVLGYFGLARIVVEEMDTIIA